MHNQRLPMRGRLILNALNWDMKFDGSVLKEDLYCSLDFITADGQVNPVRLIVEGSPLSPSGGTERRDWIRDLLLRIARGLDDINELVA